TTRIETERVVNTAALPPGTTQYQLSYLLPVDNGAVTVAVTAPAQATHLMMLVPDDGSTVVPQGIEAGGAGDMGGGKLRFYSATNVPAGSEMKLAITGIKPGMAMGIGATMVHTA